MPRINSYRAMWTSDTKVGVFKFLLERGIQSDEVKVNSPEEFSVIIDLLRNESPVYFSPGNKAITTYTEPIGEGE